MSLEQEISAFVGQANTKRRQIMRAIQRITTRSRTARKLFMDDQGQIREEAARFFAVIAHHAGMDRRGFVPDPRLRDYRDGAQDMVRFIVDSLTLDGRQLDHLTQQLRNLDPQKGN